MLQRFRSYGAWVTVRRRKEEGRRQNAEFLTNLPRGFHQNLLPASACFDFLIFTSFYLPALTFNGLTGYDSVGLERWMDVPRRSGAGIYNGQSGSFALPNHII